MLEGQVRARSSHWHSWDIGFVLLSRCRGISRLAQMSGQEEGTPTHWRTGNKSGPLDGAGVAGHASATGVATVVAGDLGTTVLLDKLAPSESPGKADDGSSIFDFEDPGNSAQAAAGAEAPVSGGED